MAQERVLAVSELFHMICGHLRPTAEGKQALARLACCCRRFMDPALDVLWSELVHTRPLLDLIPSLTVTTGKTDFDDDVDTYTLLHPLGEEDWYRFDFYGSRVRNLLYDNHADVDCKIYSQLAEYRLTPMLPNLRYLHWHHGPVDGILDTRFVAEVTPFLTNSLKIISVGTFYHEFLGWALPVDDTHPLEVFLHMLPRRCPATQEFVLFGTMPDIKLACLGKFKHLRLLDLAALCPEGRFVDDNMLNALADLMFLEHLYGLQVFGGQVTRPSSTPGFPSLLHLSLSRADASGSLILLNRISSKSLRSFEIDNLAASTPETILACMSRLGQFSETIEEIDIRSTAPHSVTKVGLPCIESLLMFHRLEILTVDLGEHTKWPIFTPEYADRIACAWSRLKSLSMSQCHFPIQSFPAFASRCSLLASLCIHTLFITDPLGTMDITLSLTPHRRLRNVNISSYSSIEEVGDYITAAGVLDRLFPRMNLKGGMGPIFWRVNALRDTRKAITQGVKLFSQITSEFTYHKLFRRLMSRVGSAKSFGTSGSIGNNQSSNASSQNRIGPHREGHGNGRS
ncbi:hypothetical protein JAAARDRAFT_194054 [Jaapia argillacea MUCL 33604]|uniref:F-box domain-containing protein n=1 Tax=Jaapia argillacea MUCL 33604 TaxID=933084 RepID=A0A067PV96_9AGAM|nr:hypothetical protein JAAARDRAFT_194054 [Jaapia argillacea MUCL 33604]